MLAAACAAERREGNTNMKSTAIWLTSLVLFAGAQVHAVPTHPIHAEMISYHHASKYKATIEYFEGLLERAYNISFTTDIDDEFWSENSSGGKNFAPSDQVYLEILKNFAE